MSTLMNPNVMDEHITHHHHLLFAQIPTFGFLYVAGYIGYVGRQYLNKVKTEAKPTDKEIIIDVPLALNLALNGWAWPGQVVSVSIQICSCMFLHVFTHAVVAMPYGT